MPMMDEHRCDGPCGQKVNPDATVDVAAGMAVGQWDGTTAEVPHVGVSTVDSDGTPEIQQWCPMCADSQFGVGTPTDRGRIVEFHRRVTARDVWWGVVWTLTVAVLLAMQAV